MKAIQRIIEHAAKMEQHADFARTVSPGALVVAVRVEIAAHQDIVVEHVTEAGITCSDGKTYCLDGWYGNHNVNRFLVEPDDRSREAVMQGRFKRELQHFPWSELTAEQMEAVLKYAVSKHQVSPRRKAA